MNWHNVESIRAHVGEAEHTLSTVSSDDNTSGIDALDTAPLITKRLINQVISSCY